MAINYSEQEVKYDPILNDVRLTILQQWDTINALSDHLDTTLASLKSCIDALLTFIQKECTDYEDSEEIQKALSIYKLYFSPSCF